MPNEPQHTPAVFATGPDAAPSQPITAKHTLVAPLWHTLLILLLILGNSFLGSSKLSAVSGHASRLLLYGGTFITELILVLIVWFGIRSRGVRMRDLIGGRWETVESFLLDVALAIGFLVTALILLFGLRVALGLIDLHNLEKSKDEAVRMLSALAPRTYLEAGAFVVLSIFAGLFEEIIFRGYLQRQFNAIFSNAAAGIVVSGVVFGLAHGYQGTRGMVVIAVFGILFGIMAHLRKSLRPGMIAHALQDSAAGIALFRLVR